MDVTLSDLSALKTDLLFVPVLKDKKEGQKYKEVLKKLGVDAVISKLNFIAEEGATECSVSDNKQIKKIIIYGLGEKDKLDTEKLRKAMGNMCKTAQSRKLKEFAVLSAEEVLKDSVYLIARAQSEGLILGGYSYTIYKSKKEEQLEKATIVTLNPSKEFNEGFEVGKTIGETCNIVKDLGNAPSNFMTPEIFAKKAKEVAAHYKLNYKCLKEAELKKEGMNCLLGVAQGSVNSPRLVVVEHLPKKGAPVYAVVGKGVCFDSGGISLKPGKGMEEMKFDKCGAAATLAILSAISKMKLPINVVGIMPLVENLPGSSAQRPGDIVKAASGKFVEVLNTDAEGRLILADALHYTCKNYKPKAIVDLATLTGACVVALGHVASGLMGNNNELLKDLENASEISGEKIWRLPMFEDYLEDIKSQYADIKNLGAYDGAAGTITAAMFLKEFVGETPWAHLDIAGTAWTTSDLGGYSRVGATGAGVRVVVQWLMDKI